MISRLLVILSFVMLLVVAGGLIVLAAWDVPVSQEQVEKVLDNDKLLTKAP